jgi:hypothetical protein
MPEEMRRPKAQPLDGRARAAGAASSLVFLLVAALVAVEVDSPRSIHPATLALLIGAYAWCTRVRFHAGAGETMPVQIVFVAMLFLLPTPIVPLAAAAGIVLGSAPAIARHQVHADRVLVLPANAAFALGPVAVLAGAHAQTLDLSQWPILAAALAAQFACDFVGSSVLVWLVRGVPPALHLR